MLSSRNDLEQEVGPLWVSCLSSITFKRQAEYLGECIRRTMSSGNEETRGANWCFVEKPKESSDPRKFLVTVCFCNVRLFNG